MNREHWLTSIVTSLRPIVEASLESDDSERNPPVIRVSCGWPSSGGLGKRMRVLGQCWSSKVTPDGANEIFISPLVEDSIEVAGIVLHEMLHAYLPPKTKHGPAFARLAKNVGLAGKPRATVVEDDSPLAQALALIVDKTGPYPTRAMDPSLDDQRKKQTTRMIKVVCPEEVCGYTVRTTAKWILVGVPVCPNGHEMVAEQIKQIEEE